MTTRQEPNTPGTDVGLVRFFITCQIVGWVGITLVLITALASPYVRQRRHPTWFSFCVTWIVSCISYLLLSFAGQQLGGPPSKGICTAQAALVYSAPSLTAWSTASLVIQLWFNIREMFATSHVTLAHRQFKIFLLLAAPYFIHLVLFFISLGIALSNPEKVKRAESGVYCVITTGVPGRISGVSVVLALIVTLVFEGMVIAILYRNRKHFVQSYNASSKNMGTMIRVAVFSIFGISTIGVSLVFLSDLDSVVPNVFLAITPVMAVLIFSSQADLFSVWMFWRKQTYDPLNVRSTPTSHPSHRVMPSDSERSFWLSEK